MATVAGAESNDFMYQGSKHAIRTENEAFRASLETITGSDISSKDIPSDDASSVVGTPNIVPTPLAETDSTVSKQ